MDRQVSEAVYSRRSLQTSRASLTRRCVAAAASIAIFIAFISLASSFSVARTEAARVGGSALAPDGAGRVPVPEYGLQVSGPLRAVRPDAARLPGMPGAPQVSPTVCSSGAWSEQSPYPTPIAENAVASQGGFVYSFGGLVNNASIANAYRYNPANNSWTTIAPLPGARSLASAVSDGTYIYILGGADQNFNSTSTIWRYDPAANTYNTSLASYTIPTYGQAAAYLNGKVYRIAGRAIGTDFHVEVYNVATNSWSMAANYPFANHDLMAVALGGYIYAGGGNASPSRTWRYDPATDTWDDNAVADFPQGRQASASGVYNGRWILAGGDVNFANSTSAIAWDPGTNSWSTLPDMVQAREYMGGASAGGAFYVVGGFSSPGTPNSDNQRYQEGACGTTTATPSATSTAASTSTPSRTPTPPVTPSSTPGCTAGWSIVPSPNTGSADNRLFGVAAIAPNDVWAVGWSYDGSTQQTLTEHWNGAQWSIVPSLNLGPVFNELLGVAAIAPNDVWAVGWHSTLEHTLVEHWNGVQWSIVPSADPLSYNILSAVSARAANDIWAAGWSSNGTTHQTLVEHWDGSSWAAVPTIDPTSSDARLFGVAAVPGASDVWAVGRYYDGTFFRTLTEQWNGSSFSIVPSPNAGSSDSYLSAVAAIAPNDVWAADRYGPTGAWQTLTEHWNGVGWSIVPSPNGGSPSVLDGLAAIGPNDVWAAGGWSQTLTLHWDGAQWSIVPSPNAAASSILQGVAALSSSNLWSVGYSYTNSSSQTLIEHYAGQCATASATPSPQVPTPTATGTATTPATPTSTLPAPTLTPTAAQTSIVTPSATATSGGATATSTSGTPTATSTACPIQFTDVPNGSTFYPYIRCLACRGIVSGYDDHTFRPGNNVTRGQLSKIVSNSAGFSDPQPNQAFEDVPVGSTFQVYIGRLSSRGIIGGYPCGGPGEPCGPGSLPYFRPNANATRGQITKIDANAANYTDPPVGQQFQDVPPGSTFYTYTYQLVTRSIMSGYPCGGPGEPCVPPANLPYFRPNNNATRGQTSKIVANTFFPNCQTPSGAKR